MYRFLSIGKREEELTEQVAQLRREFAEATNATNGKGEEELAKQVAQLRSEFAKANAANGNREGELTEQVAQVRRELDEELSRVAQVREMLEDELSRGFWRRLFGLRSKRAPLGLRLQQPPEDADSARDRASEDMERIREQTRGRIAYALIFTLIGVVLATILYIGVLTAFGVLGTQDAINVIQGLGTTLLAPIVGLIGAVIGFYYGGQTAVQGTEQARKAATETASQVADKAANQAADKAVKAVADNTKEAREATQKATEAANKANRAVQVAQDVLDNNDAENTNV